MHLLDGDIDEIEPFQRLNCTKMFKKEMCGPNCTSWLTDRMVNGLDFLTDWMVNRSDFLMDRMVNGSDG